MKEELKKEINIYYDEAEQQLDKVFDIDVDIFIKRFMQDVLSDLHGSFSNYVLDKLIRSAVNHNLLAYLACRGLQKLMYDNAGEIAQRVKSKHGASLSFSRFSELMDEDIMA